MSLNVSFANPIGPYDLLWNRCVTGFCHVETSIELELHLFRVILQNNKDKSYDKDFVQDLLDRTQNADVKSVNACFYIMFGDKLDVRFLNPISTDPLMRPPERPVYETISIPVTDTEQEAMVSFLVQNLGRSYDVPRALLLLSAVTLRLEGQPEKYFCSQLVMHTLKVAGIYKDDMARLDINHMTPLNVYTWLSSQKPRVLKEDDTDKEE